MTATAGPAAIAVHIGADVLVHPRYAAWARPRSCDDTLRRVWRLCRAAGVRVQRRLLGPGAALGRVREAITDAAAATGPGGLFVLTFSGHSQRPVAGGCGGGWCLYDGLLPHTQTAQMLAALPRSAHIVVVVDSCYAAAFATVLPSVPAGTVLLAACGAHQATLNWPTSEFVATLEQLTFPDAMANPDCVSYAWLHRQLRRDTPDVERPEVHANRLVALRHRPFTPGPV